MITRFLDSKNNLTVRSGSTMSDSGGFVHQVTEAILHPNYNRSNEDYDVALFGVDPAFEMSTTTRAIELPPGGDEDLKTKWGSVAGWGAFSVEYIFVELLVEPFENIQLLL